MCSSDLYENGRLSGPEGFSTLGMRIQNEQSGSTSLFAHPMAIEAIPEDPASERVTKKMDSSPLSCQGTTSVVPQEQLYEVGALAPEGSSSGNALEVPPSSEASLVAPARLARGILEARMESALATLVELSETPSSTLRQGHLALLKRWYYRSEVKRAGDIFFPDAEGNWPVKAMLRGVGRVAAKMLGASSHAE